MFQSAKAKDQDFEEEAPELVFCLQDLIVDGQGGKQNQDLESHPDSKQIKAEFKKLLRSPTFSAMITQDTRLLKIPIQIGRITRVKSGGYFDGGKGYIRILPHKKFASKRLNVPRIFSTLIHELRHADQYLYHFYKSGYFNPKTIEQKVVESWFKEADARAFVATVAYELKLRHAPFYWNLFHDTEPVVYNYFVKALKEDPKALEDGTAQAAALDGFFMDEELMVFYVESTIHYYENLISTPIEIAARKYWGHDPWEEIKGNAKKANQDAAKAQKYGPLSPFFAAAALDDEEEQDYYRGLEMPFAVFTEPGNPKKVIFKKRLAYAFSQRMEGVIADRFLSQMDPKLLNRLHQVEQKYRDFCEKVSAYIKEEPSRQFDL